MIVLARIKQFVLLRLHTPQGLLGLRKARSEFTWQKEMPAGNRGTESYKGTSCKTSHEVGGGMHGAALSCIN